MARSTRGGITAGYAAMAVVVAALVTGVVTLGVPALVGSHTARATCDIFHSKNNCDAKGDAFTPRKMLPSFTLTSTSTPPPTASPSWTPTKGQVPPPTVAELIADCDGTAYLPDGQTTGNTMSLDGCTYEEQSAWDDMQWQDLDWLSNCIPPPTQPGFTPAPPADESLTGSNTWITSFSIGASLGGSSPYSDKLPWGGLTFSASFTYTKSVTITRTTTIHVPNGHKGAITAGQAMHHSRGRIRVNYSNNRLGGHYIWYINDVAMDTPILSPHEQKDGRNDYQDQGTEDKPCTDKLLHEKNPPYGFTPWSSP